MTFSKDEVEDIFWMLMSTSKSDCPAKIKILNKIFEVYSPCPICAGFFEKSDNHFHEDID
ncbi:hypothetical protein [Acinetobacter nosocomialis]|uniref:hypothetical protein n=1 Tax=Acinetobacter nosocomialis TaxID=106654 RepID=UPI001FF161C7|nr:hypothetical protein [Acinetobacter nosocomialis]MCJ9032787.1 hypothetical protein [Acinetobacter nosocomialis]